MTHLWGDADLVSCPLSGCYGSVGLAVAGNWARYTAFPTIFLPGWVFGLVGKGADAWGAAELGGKTNY